MYVADGMLLSETSLQHVLVILAVALVGCAYSWYRTAAADNRIAEEKRLREEAERRYSELEAWGSTDEIVRKKKKNPKQNKLRCESTHA